MKLPEPKLQAKSPFIDSPSQQHYTVVGRQDTPANRVVSQPPVIHAQAHGENKPNKTPAKLSAQVSTQISYSPKHPFLTYLNDYPTLAATTNQLLTWDTSLCIHINRYSSYQRIAAFFKAVSRLGDGWFWGVMLFAALLSQYMAGTTGWTIWLPIFSIMLTSSIGVGLYKILKIKTVRPRPYQVHQVIIMGERPLDVFSFPSGHTLQAVLFTCALGGYFPILLWLMVPFALLVALSRMVLGLHYPTDVAIGALIGAGLAQLSPLIYQLLNTLIA